MPNTRPSNRRALAAARTKDLARLPERFAIAGTVIRPEQLHRLPERQPPEYGPWTGEPGKLAWSDVATGLACIILRQTNATLSGYVAVGPDHPLWLYNHDALPAAVRNAVHGGIDYAEPCRQHGPEVVQVCHVRPDRSPSDVPGDDDHHEHDGHPDDKRWFGFRTSHPGDLVPIGDRPRHHREEGETYRSIAYVFDEVRALARVLKALETGSGGVSDERDRPLQIGSDTSAGDET